MGQKLSNDQPALYRAIDEVLFWYWDPIGVAGEPGARDEYQEYLPQVLRLLQADDRAGIVQFLSEIERTSMGMQPKTAHCEEVADKLLEWKRFLADRSLRTGS